MAPFSQACLIEPTVDTRSSMMTLSSGERRTSLLQQANAVDSSKLDVMITALAQKPLEQREKILSVIDYKD